MVINQGDVFWCEPGSVAGSAPAYRRPYLVVQNNIFNRSRIHTVVTCALTTNLRRAHDPGNVLLARGEANLPRRSVVNVSQLVSVDKDSLGEKIGTVSHERLRQVLSGIWTVLEPREIDAD